MSDLIKLSSFLGGPKVLVGDGTTDIVLNTLGKVYVKTGRNTQLLTDLFSLLSNTDTSTASITFVDSTEEQKALEYPGDGYFIYNTLTETLYISYKNAYVPLIDASQYSSGTFVKKAGDTMSGQLELTTYKAPFIIASKKLVENLNAEYLGGYKENSYPKKIKNERITGEWVFSGDGTSEGKWIFKDTIRCYGNLVTSGSLQSPTFISGFSGQGWRLDTATGTFTIDYLVVRKAMQVYELVINKISATNGSLWITNSSKCDSVLQPTIISTLDNISSLESNTYYLIQYSDYYTTTNINNNNYTTYNYLFYFLDINSLIEDQGDLTYADLITLLNTLIAGTTTNVNIKVYNIGEELNKDAVFRIYENDTESLKYLYYDYFASNSNNYWVINTDSKETPLLKVGDIVRCQKYADGNIKYYDAVIVKQLDSNIYIIQVAASVFDQYSNISYDEDGNIINCTTSANTTQYSKTNTYYSAITGTTQSLNTESILASPSENDDLVQIGNIQDTSRQNAIYLTSTDDQGPYIDIITGLNRPDYLVAYNTVNYIKYIYNNISYYVRIIDNDTDENFIGYFTLDDYNNPTSTNDTSGIKLAKSTTPLYLDTNGNLAECLKETDDNGNFIHNYTKTTQVRLGNLDGIYDSTFPANRQPNGFGLYGQNVFLTGQFYLNNGKSVIDASYDSILLKFGTAGLTIGEDSNKESFVKLYGDKIWIVTLDDNGAEKYTALFKDGEVNVNKLICVNSANVKVAAINEDDNGLRTVYYPEEYTFEINGIHDIDGNPYTKTYPAGTVPVFKESYETDGSGCTGIRVTYYNRDYSIRTIVINGEKVTSQDYWDTFKANIINTEMDDIKNEKNPTTYEDYCLLKSTELETNAQSIFYRFHSSYGADTVQQTGSTYIYNGKVSNDGVGLSTVPDSTTEWLGTLDAPVYILISSEKYSKSFPQYSAVFQVIAQNWQEYIKGELTASGKHIYLNPSNTIIE